MSGQLIGTYPCVTCGAAVKRAGSEPICKACYAVAEAAFRAAHPYSGPDAWVRERNAFFGNREVLVAVIRASRLAAV